MESKYDHKIHEQRIYEKWEKSGAFKAEVDKNKKPYTILLPPPNASGKMHIGKGCAAMRLCGFREQTTQVSKHKLHTKGN